MKTYTFLVQGKDKHGHPIKIYQDMTHKSEEEARRETIHRCNGLLNIYPRKLTLTRKEKYRRSPFDFS